MPFQSHKAHRVVLISPPASNSLRKRT